MDDHAQMALTARHVVDCVMMCGHACMGAGQRKSSHVRELPTSGGKGRSAAVLCRE